jgi:zinc protease
MMGRIHGPAGSAPPSSAPGRRAPLRPAAAMRAGLAALSILSALSSPARAMPGVDEPPQPQPTRPVVVPDFDEQRLPNGLRVVVARRTDLPLVTVLLLSAGGSAADPAGRAGLAGTTATLLTKGATRNGKRLDATQIARQAEALGSTLDAGADRHSLSVAMTINTTKLDAAVALIADVVRRPSFDQDELDRVREQSIDALKLSLSDPAALAGMVARRSFWGTGPYGSLATPATLARIQRQDVQGFHAQTVRESRSTLIFAGDVTPAKALQLARARFGDWRTRPPAPRSDAAAPPAPPPPATVVVNLPGAGQSGVVVTAPFVGANDPQRRVGQVASAVLGGGYSARLNQEIRIKRGLAYGAGTAIEAHPREPGAEGSSGPGGMLSASTQTNHPTAAQVAELVRGEILRLAEAPVPPDELAARQATLVGSLARRLETTGGLAGLAADQLSNGRELKELKNAPEEILAVTAEQVREFAAQRLTPASLRTVVVGDVKQAGEALQKLDPKALQIDAANLKLEGPVLN